MKQLFYFAILATGLVMPIANAQHVKAPLETEGNIFTSRNTLSAEQELKRKQIIENLEEEKKNIIEIEKYNLKKAVEAIAAQEEKGTLTPEQAQKAKEEAAKLAALNIDNKTAIVENQAELARRNEYYNFEPTVGTYVELGLGNAYDAKGSALLGIHYNASNRTPRYDKRTYSDIVIASGFCNTIGDGRTIGDTYKFGKSNYGELGIALRTRLLKNSNTFRLAYGVSVQAHIYVLQGNQHIVNNNGTTLVQEFPYNLKDKSFIISNVVIPVHLEFGPSVKREYKDYFRYDTGSKFKAGIGGYAGINASTVQRLNYKVNGTRFVDKMRTDYNVNRFIYGLSGYVGIGGMSLFAKYDLNPVFKNSLYKDHNITIGLRLDL
jgi:hypothetical protein